jgi:multimeric flavodoxin WrbA
MKTITLEIEEEKDYQEILKLANKVGAKIISNFSVSSNQKTPFEEIKDFYLSHSKDFGDFKFNREEANER